MAGEAAGQEAGAAGHVVATAHTLTISDCSLGKAACPVRAVSGDDTDVKAAGGGEAEEAVCPFARRDSDRASGAAKPTHPGTGDGGLARPRGTQNLCSNVAGLPALRASAPSLLPCLSFDTILYEMILQRLATDS
jgi:hypothetical protein